ncbi:fibroin heavy chain-like [Amphibalanus amphitrite]|uniref:fibroin heavy chain-like n=1 Tax=Amphibalanus amphitrite TaxID=1232801 RepID=UPI001C905CF4|nr:fibroin heavy chain-like [Amphibalanus amphitrite]
MRIPLLLLLAAAGSSSSPRTGKKLLPNRFSEPIFPPNSTEEQDRPTTKFSEPVFVESLVDNLVENLVEEGEVPALEPASDDILDSELLDPVEPAGGTPVDLSQLRPAGQSSGGRPLNIDLSSLLTLLGLGSGTGQGARPGGVTPPGGSGGSPTSAGGGAAGVGSGVGLLTSGGNAGGPAAGGGGGRPCESAPMTRFLLLLFASSALARPESRILSSFGPGANAYRPSAAFGAREPAAAPSDSAASAAAAEVAGEGVSALGQVSELAASAPIESGYEPGGEEGVGADVGLAAESGVAAEAGVANSPSAGQEDGQFAQGLGQGVHPGFGAGQGAHPGFGSGQGFQGGFGSGQGPHSGFGAGLDPSEGALGVVAGVQLGTSGPYQQYNQYQPYQAYNPYNGFLRSADSDIEAETADKTEEDAAEKET